MNEFVEECRREWRRLGVPDPVANEMAADLTADLQEAEAEGASPEDVLGNSAFDPRRFAAAWATARGVTGAVIPDRPPFWRPPMALAFAVLVGVLIVGAGLVFLVGSSSRSISVATRRFVGGPGPIRIFPQGLGQVTSGPGGPFGAIKPLPIAFALLFIGVVSLVALAVLYWSPWAGLRRFQRKG